MLRIGDTDLSAFLRFFELFSDEGGKVFVARIASRSAESSVFNLLTIEGTIASADGISQ